MGFLRASLRAFYSGNFAEAVRIAVILRVLVHESRGSKPLLLQASTNGLELPILANIVERPSGPPFPSHLVLFSHFGSGCPVLALFARAGNDTACTMWF